MRNVSVRLRHQVSRLDSAIPAVHHVSNASDGRLDAGDLRNQSDK